MSFPVKDFAKRLNKSVPEVLGHLTDLGFKDMTEDSLIEPKVIQQLMAIFQKEKLSSKTLGVADKPSAKTTSNTQKLSVRKRRQPVSSQTQKQDNQKNKVDRSKIVVNNQESELSSSLTAVQANHRKQIEQQREQKRLEQEKVNQLKQQELQQQLESEQQETKRQPKSAQNTEHKIADKVSSKTPASNKNSADLDDKSKLKVSRTKVLKEQEEKNWKKRSHRVQDFIIDEQDSETKKKEMVDQKSTINIENKHKFVKPVAKQVRTVVIPPKTSIAQLAKLIALKPKKLLQGLKDLGEEIPQLDNLKETIAQDIDQDLAMLLVEHIGHKGIAASSDSVIDKIEETRKTQLKQSKSETRPPVITVMGHVDHGKTSLLDCIRKANIADSEVGGITQHIGAYEVNHNGNRITFIDTPGHSAFSSMRARGAKITDIIVLVVAADDGVKPQTKEVVSHATNADVPLVIAVNKMDKEGANTERVINELSQIGVVTEAWGGDVPMVPISAKKGEGIDDLLENIDLQAEILDLKTSVGVPADGVVIESKLDKNRGTLATLLIQNGTLKVGDTVLVGTNYGRVRSMNNENGEKLQSAVPSMPVEILGLNGVPEAGTEFRVLKNEREARKASQFNEQQMREAAENSKKMLSIDAIFENLQNDNKKKISILLKSDMQGTLEALIKSLAEISDDNVEVEVVHSAVGGINESDINLAISTTAIIIGFDVRADNKAKNVAEKAGIEIRYYDNIYKVVEDTKNLAKGLVKPELHQEIVGIAEVRDVFNSPRYGKIAGCYVTEGTVYRNDPIRVLRDNIVIYSGHLESLRRIKEDVASVRSGIECGIGVKDYNDVQVGDLIEVYREREG